LQYVLVYWLPAYFEFIVSTAIVRYTLAKVQLVNLHVQHKSVGDYVNHIWFPALSLFVETIILSGLEVLTILEFNIQKIYLQYRNTYWWGLPLFLYALSTENHFASI
jgi:hypothetical protein